MRLTFLLLLFPLLSACLPAQMNTAVVPPAPTVPSTPAQLQVRGEGKVEVVPDQLQMRLGVVTQAADADQAMVENNQRMAAVMKMLDEIGIARENMATGQFQVRPEWSLPPRPTPANWEREIIGYRISNDLLISTTRVELAGRLLAVAQKAGANQVGGLQFSLADPEAHRQEAIRIATRKAVREAETLASAAGVQLGRVISLNLDSSRGMPQPQLMMAEARTASADSVPIAAGKVEVSASVSLIYALRDADQPGRP